MRMKEKYQKPTLTFEEYELSASIAANCAVVVSFGPGDEQNVVCEEFEGIWDIQLMQERGGTSFYEEGTGAVCDCYYSSSGDGYFTS